MELIERYLQSVKFWLPKEQREDIIAELSEDICTQVEEQQSALGRKLNELEASALLKQRGNPLVVATRFLPQRSLIGPVLLPVYWFVLKIVAAVYAVASIALFFTNVTAIDMTPAFTSFAIVTIIFAILERNQARGSSPGGWDPRKLPPVRNPNLISRLSSAIELAVSLAVLSGWASYAYGPFIPMSSQGSDHLILSPLWVWFFWGFSALLLASIIMACVNLLRPYWTGMRASLRFITDAAGGGLFCWLMQARIVSGSSSRAAEFANAINWSTTKTFPWDVAVSVVIVGFDIYRIVRLKARKVEILDRRSLKGTLSV